MIIVQDFDIVSFRYKTDHMKQKHRVAIIMGSLTDYKVLKKAEKLLKELKIPYVTEVVSAHRSPKFMYEFASNAHTKNISVIIAGAGGAAHLPGMVASLTHLPVIGVPIQLGSLKGLDALLSIAQMPKGIPVACMAVDNAENAALMAARIIGISDESIQKKVILGLKKNRMKVKSMNKILKKF
jgi:5-(carboxyamino)imidazole ribonucleotide mutase